LKWISRCIEFLQRLRGDGIAFARGQEEIDIRLIQISWHGSSGDALWVDCAKRRSVSGLDRPVDSRPGFQRGILYGRAVMQESIRAMDSERFRFGLFEFDAATRELRRGGVLVRLQSQPARVLSSLVEHRGEVVSRESLCEAVWGAGTFVDFERGLNFCIAQIRSALNDDSVSPRYVRTIPKRGYQFIAPVEHISAAPERSELNSERRGFSTKAVAISCAMVLVTIAFFAGYRLRSRQVSKPSPIVAVVRFDNETGDANMVRFSDGLTDTLVAQLTALSRQQYGVIGNARILRLPRDQRDLRTIAESLHAQYAVVGQVQGNGSQTRILAHLIRLPDQTHLWVARMDRLSTDPLDVELEAAQKIAAAFSPLVVKDASGSPLPPFPNQ
jgi:DNA-binding winged helix-turn-helix (wHTH) protein/TolB-like protein